MPLNTDYEVSIDTPRITMANGDVNEEYVGLGKNPGTFRALVMRSGALVIQKQSNDCAWFVKAVIASGQWVKVT